MTITLNPLSQTLNHSISLKPPHTLVVIDSQVRDLEIIFKALLPGSIGYKIEPTEQAIDKITELISQTGAKRLAIVAHGEAGVIKIGANPLDLAHIQTRSTLMQEWSIDEILLYSCEVGKSDRGELFVRQLGEITGANIAASATKVGATELGGSWELEITTGKVTPNLIFQQEVLLEYPAVLKAGDLDPSFGTKGQVRTDFNGKPDEANGAIIQSDNKIIALGNDKSDFELARYNADGSLDPSFGNNGKVTTDFSSSDVLKSGIQQSDGKIVVGGKIVGNVGFGDFGLARYNSDGTLDTSFGTNGKVTTNFNPVLASIESIVQQSDGKILATGGVQLDTRTPGSDIGLARYNSDGTLDNTFGTNGIVTTNSGAPDGGRTVIEQNDGKILVAGQGSLTRYASNGTLDTSFGTNGIAKTSGLTNSAAQQSDGKVITIGRTGNDLGVARYNNDGSLDTSFGVGGKVTTDFNNGRDEGFSIAVQKDGKIVVAGTANDPAAKTFNSNFALARYNSDGSLDNSFGNNGKVTTDVNTGTEEFNRIKLQSDGNILAIGTSGDDFALSRYVSADRASADQINGTSGDDILNGTSADDVINGLAGNDILIGGGGNDTLTGGDGNDKFSFSGGTLPAGQSITAVLGTDTITDFTAGDKIVLSKQIFSALGRDKGKLNKPDFATVADDSFVDAKSAEIVYSQSSGALFYNANGKAAGLGNEGGIFATLTGLPTLTANDFTLIQ
jgi:uncharacterized delta-60 repeat protein